MAFSIAAVCADQYVKKLILDGFRYDGEYISIIYVLNDGVAFSMLAFLKEYLKFIQIGVLVAALAYVASQRYFKRYAPELGLIFGSGASNIYARFIHGGVVDYVYWHHWFNFAVFNLADVLIDTGIVLIIIKVLKKR